MKQGLIHMYSGDGHGKSPAALGKAVLSAAAGENVVIIQFLKEKGLNDSEFISRLEPEIKIFRFEKSDEFYDQLTQTQQSEEVMNIRNGINFARKVVQTGGCEVLILDELLGLLDNKIITMEDIREIVEHKSEDMELIFTGRFINDELMEIADSVSKVETMK